MVTSNEFLSLFIGNALTEMVAARQDAVLRHGPLKAGPVRWERLISEEYQEVCDELATLSIPGGNYEDARNQAKVAAVHELAQLAQLCIGVIELIQAGKLQEEE